MSGFIEPLVRGAFDFWYLKVFRKICKDDRCTEIYVLVFLVLLAIGSSLYSVAPHLWFYIACYRFVDLFAVNLRMVLFVCAYRSRGRTLILSGINYVQLILIFSIFYQKADGTLNAQTALELSSDVMRTFSAAIPLESVAALIKLQGVSAFAFAAIIVSYLVQLRGNNIESDEVAIPKPSLPNPINFLLGSLLGLLFGLLLTGKISNLDQSYVLFVGLFIILAATTFITSRTVSNIGQFGSADQEKLRAFMKAHLNFYAVIVLMFVSILHLANRISYEFFLAVFVGVCTAIGIKLYKSSGE